MPANKHRTDIQVRFADTDALGHINNVSVAAYAETARLDFLSKIGQSVRSLILANLTIDYRRQIDFTDRLYVESWIDKLGNSSMAVSHIIFANDERAVDVKSVVVHFDYTTNKSMPLSDEIRRVLQPFVHSA